MEAAAAAPVPPVIDTTRNVRIETALGEAPAKMFTPFHIAVALVILLVIFFLYKRYRDKKATESAHGLMAPPK